MTWETGIVVYLLIAVILCEWLIYYNRKNKIDTTLLQYLMCLFFGPILVVFLIGQTIWQKARK